MIDEKIKKLRELTDNFLFIEYYSHSNTDMYKIKNEYTQYNEEKIVLCELNDGIERALDLAIEYITKKKNEFFN